MSHRNAVPWFHALVLLASVVTTRAAAQATRDQPTLTMGLSGGYSIGTSNLWHVPNQPISASGGLYDIFDINRDLTGNVMFTAQAALFRSPHLGYSAELTYFGVGTHDTCSLAQATGDAINRLACQALNRNARSTSATSFLAGAVVRPWARKLFQPYLRVEGGFSAITDNLVAMTAYIGSAQNLVVPVYPSSGGLAIRPTGVLGLGVATNSGAGYLFKVEVRQTWLALNRVTGPSSSDGIAPPIGSRFRSFPTLLVGFDIVLEKSRGRRY